MSISISETRIFFLALGLGAKWRQNLNTPHRQWNRLKFGTVNNYDMASELVNLKMEKILLAPGAGANWRQSPKNISCRHLNCLKSIDIG